MRQYLALALCSAALLFVAVPFSGARRVRRGALPSIALKDQPVVPKLKLLEARNGRKLDIVIAHYHLSTVHTMLTDWTRFLDTDKVKAMQPTVFVYSLNDEVDPGVYQPLTAKEGVVYHLINVGREGAVYLTHIINYWDNLAEHTLCSQAAADPILPGRFEHLFEPRTGIMSLALYAHQECALDDGWLPTGQLVQLYSMFVRRFCPPEGYSAMFNGQFVVSKKRIQAHPREVYEQVNELLTAPLFHWIHTVHTNPHYKDVSNPFFGHALERAWSLAFNCHEHWRYELCSRCDEQQWKDCHPEACQCFDS